jgi:hypothetical protein
LPAGEAAGTAVGALVKIMQDVTISMRRRIQAADALLQYKAPEDVTEHAKVFLTSVFTNDEENIDCRLEATTLLRRFESPRIAPAVERPSYREPDDMSPEERAADLAMRMEQRRRHIERMSVEIEKQMAEEWKPATTD